MFIKPWRWLFASAVAAAIVLGVTWRVTGVLPATAPLKHVASVVEDHRGWLLLGLALGALAAAVIRRLRRRRWWARHVAIRQALRAVRPTSLHELGIWPSSVTDLAPRQVPRYVERTVDRALDARLDAPGPNPLDRLLLIAGPQLAGKSRTAFEALRRNGFGEAFLIVPRQRRSDDPRDSAAELLRTRRKLAPRQPILWLDDLGEQLATGAIAARDVLAWLQRHPTGLVVVTITESERIDLRRFRADAQDPIVQLADSFDATEEALARERYPTLGSGWRQLPGRLVLELAPIERFRDGAQHGPAGTIGRAVVRAAIDHCRCHRGLRVPKAFLYSNLHHYLGAQPSPGELAAFPEALRWALTPADGVGATLLDPCSDPDAVQVPPWLVSYADRVGWELTDDIWASILKDAETRPDELPAVAAAAEQRGREDIAKSALKHALNHARPDVRDVAYERLARLSKPAARVASAPPPAAGSPAWLLPEDHPFDPGEAPVTSSPVARAYRRPMLRAFVRGATLAIGDALTILASLAVALAILGGPHETYRWALVHYGAFTVSIAVVAFGLAGLYTADAERARLPAIVSASSLVATAGVVILLTDGFPVWQCTVALVTAAIAVPAVHMTRRGYEHAIRWLVRTMKLTPRVVLVGSPERAYEVGKLLSARSRPHMRLVGFACVEEHEASLGTLDQIGRVIGTYGIDRVIFVDPELPLERRVEVADRCHSRGVSVALLPSLEELLLGIGTAHPYRVPGPVPIPPLRFGTGAAFAKAIFDISVSVAALLALIPVNACIVAAILVTSPGSSPIVRTRRTGHEEQQFKLWRYRTTRSRTFADEEVETGDEPTPTRLGVFLRRYRLDELPQLLCVIAGQMSLVGPRPLPIAQFRQLEPWHRKRYHALPGLTGEWQILGAAPDLDEMARVDFAYITGWTLARDVATLLRTPGAVLRIARRERVRPVPAAAE